MKVARIVRVGVIAVTAAAPFGAVTACTVDVNNGGGSTPDSGVTPAPTGSSTTTPTIDAGSNPVDSSAPDSGGPVDSGIDSGPPTFPLTTVRQLSYADRFTDVSPARRHYAISGNGQRIVYSITGDFSAANPNKVFVADAMGTGPAVLVDSFVPKCFCDAMVAISDDGNTIASSDSQQIRVREAVGGASKGQIVFASNEISNIGINGNGTEVYSVQRRDNSFPPPSNAPVQRGLYKMGTTTGADITTITQLLSPNEVAALISEPDATQIFPFNGCGSQSLAFSTDGTKQFVAVQHKTKQLVVAVGATKKVIVPEVEGFVHGIASTRDGSKVTAAISNTIGPKFGEIVLVGGDGSAFKKITDASNGCGTPMSITDDGANIAAGNTSYVYPTNGGERWPVLIQTGSTGGTQYYVGEPDGAESRDMWMTPDGKRFMFLSSPDGGARRIAIAELGTSALSVPSFTNGAISTTFVTRATATVNGTTATITVKASSPFFFGMQDLLNGELESQLEGQKALRDDGAGNDTTKGDNVFASDNVYAQKDTIVGARILRVKAEAQDTTTKRRTGFAIDYSGFEVK